MGLRCSCDRAVAELTPFASWLDTFSKQVLSTLEPEVFTSLSRKQYAAFRHTLERARPIRRHAVNIRGVVPQRVACYYFGLLAGRDRRDGKRYAEQELWSTMSSVLGTVVVGSVLLVPILSVILLMATASRASSVSH